MAQPMPSQPLPDERLRSEWQEHLAQGESAWYEGGVNYWKQQDRSVNGVLGGYAVLNAPDVEGSAEFIKHLKRLDPPVTFGHVADCGAGMGRVTKHLLLHYFAKADLIEPCEHLLEEAQLYINDARAEKFVQLGLQDFYPEKGRYDVIWNQWCCLYLTDQHLVQYLARCKEAVKPGGLVCVKENVVLAGKHAFDLDDNSITRTDEHYRQIFALAGLTVVGDMRQGNWPNDLFPVMMYALR